MWVPYVTMIRVAIASGDSSATDQSMYRVAHMRPISYPSKQATLGEDNTPFVNGPNWKCNTRAQSGRNQDPPLSCAEQLQHRDDLKQCASSITSDCTCSIGRCRHGASVNHTTSATRYAACDIPPSTACGRSYDASTHGAVAKPTMRLTTTP